MPQVRLTNLEGEQARHNAEAGTIFEFDEASGLYGVELGSGDAIPVAPACTVLPDGSIATVCGLQGAPQYNGCLGRILSHDDEAGRYLVALDDAKQLRLKRANLRA